MGPAPAVATPEAATAREIRTSIQAEGLISYSAVQKIALPPEAFPKVRCVLRSGVGYDTIDVPACTANGVMLSIAPDGVAWMTDIEKYLSFVLTMFVAFGVTFEVPVAVVLLVHMGVVSVEKLREIRPYVIVGAFVIGAVFTPPDVVSQLLLALPLWVLYEAGIIVASMMSKRDKGEAGAGEVSTGGPGQD